MFLRLEIIKKGITALGVVCSVPFGIFGLIYFQLINTVLAFFINTYYSGRLIKYGALSQLRDIIPILLLAASIGGVLWWLMVSVVAHLGWSDTVVLLSIGFTYLCSYLGISYFLRLEAIQNFRKLVLKR